MWDLSRNVSQQNGRISTDKIPMQKSVHTQTKLQSQKLFKSPLIHSPKLVQRGMRNGAHEKKEICRISINMPKLTVWDLYFVQRFHPLVLFSFLFPGHMLFDRIIVSCVSVLHHSCQICTSYTFSPLASTSCLVSFWPTSVDYCPRPIFCLFNYQLETPKLFFTQINFLPCLIDQPRSIIVPAPSSCFPLASTSCPVSFWPTYVDYCTRPIFTVYMFIAQQLKEH